MLCRHSLAIVPAALLLAASVGAQEIDTDRAASIAVGESDLYPAVRIDYLGTDNALLSETDELDATSVVLRPRALWVADRRGLRLSANYAGSWRESDVDALDVVDHRLDIGGGIDFTSRHRASATLGIGFDHQDVGTEFTLGEGDETSEPVRFRDTVARLRYTFGARTARANIRLGLNSIQREYLNLDEVDDRDADFRRITPSLAFAYRLGADTRAVAEASFSDVKHDNPSSERTTVGFALGLEFEATGRLGGGVELGAVVADYELDERDEATVLTAEADLRYRPVEFAQLTLTLQREIDDTVNSGAGDRDPAIETVLQLGWNHAWNSRVSSRTSIGFETNERDCPGRNDTITTAGLELDYALRRWLSVGAVAGSRSRTAETCDEQEASRENPEYGRLAYGVFLSATL